MHNGTGSYIEQLFQALDADIYGPAWAGWLLGL